MATAGARGPAPSAIGASKGVWPARLAAARGRRRWKGAHEGGHHTIISPTSVFRSKLGSKLGSRPEPRAKVAPTARVAREVVHRLSEPTLHVVHPVASRLRLHRHAEEPIVLRLGARVERGSVAAPRHRESDDVRRDGGRLPAQQAELQHRVDRVEGRSALVGGRPSCGTALEVSFGAMARGRCARTPAAAQLHVVVGIVRHAACARVGG